MQISKSVEYKNIHIRISFHVEVSHMSICVHELRPGSDAVLHMSRIEFEFRPTQINLGRLN